MSYRLDASRPRLSMIFVAALFLPGTWSTATAQHTETPIKVGGGAMTFYLDSLDGDWVPRGPRSRCALFTNISAYDSDVSSVTIKDFDHKDSQTLVSASSASGWSITLVTKGTHAVVMEGKIDECGSGTGFGVKITINTDGFYKDELPGRRRNQRFKDLNCVGTTDQDECERLDTVVLQADGVPHRCDDLDCRVLVGSAAILPAHRLRHRPHRTRGLR